LKREFPEVQGFSVTNLKYMQRFYKYYSELAQIRQQATDEFRHQPGDELLALVSQIPWRHNVEIMTRSQSPDEALFYVQKTIENGGVVPYWFIKSRVGFLTEAGKQSVISR